LIESVPVLDICRRKYILSYTGTHTLQLQRAIQ
jgi:hypothetical protein